MKKLGFGLMRLPQTNAEDTTAIDLSLAKEMADVFLQRGFTYFDTAWMYHGGASERAAKELLTSRYSREDFVLATKLPPWSVKSFEDRDTIFETQLEKTGAGYFDYYLLHCIGKETLETFEKYDCFTWIAEKKQQGKIKRMGFSFHDTAETLDAVLTAHPEMEFVQLQLNYLDWESADVQSRLCYETARRHGKPIIVMEPIKGGTLANLPPTAEAILREIHPDWSPASWAVRFVAGLPGVFMVLSGMSTMEQLQDNTAYMSDCAPLTERELEALRQVTEILRGSGAIPCTGCGYCVDGCPQGIAIPRCFSLYNTDKRQDPEEEMARTSAFDGYDALVKNSGKASACIGCGQCAEACPQHLDIPALLNRVAARFEG